MAPRLLGLGGSGQINMGTKPKEYWDGYQAGISSCNNWKDFHPPYEKETKEYEEYYEGFKNALDDLVYSYGSTGC